MPEKKPGFGPLIRTGGPSKPNPNRTATATATPAQPSGTMPTKAMPNSKPKIVDPQFGVTMKKKAVAKAIAKKKADVKKEAY